MKPDPDNPARPPDCDFETTLTVWNPWNGEMLHCFGGHTQPVSE